jgi:hypothetical protein
LLSFLAVFEVPQLAAASVVLELAHRAVVSQNLEIVNVAAPLEFQFRFQQLATGILAAVLGDDRFQRQNLAGAAQLTDFIVVAPGLGWICQGQSHQQRENQNRDSMAVHGAIREENSASASG